MTKQDEAPKRAKKTADEQIAGIIKALSAMSDEDRARTLRTLHAMFGGGQ